MDIKHYLLTQDGRVREFEAAEASRIANGLNALPEYADSDLRYVQVVVDSGQEENSLQVKTAGAMLHFDHAGNLAEAQGSQEGEEDPISRFEHDTCVQLALQDTIVQEEAIH